MPCNAKNVPWHTWAIVALAFVTAVAGVVFAALKFGTTRKKFREWIHANHDSLGRLSDTFTVAWVTMQTLCLVVENHSSVGGEDPPSLVSWLATGYSDTNRVFTDHPPHSTQISPPAPIQYWGFLSTIGGFVSLEFLSIFPGTDCWYKGYIWSLVGNTMLALAFTLGSLVS